MIETVLFGAGTAFELSLGAWLVLKGVGIEPP